MVMDIFYNASLAGRNTFGMKVKAACLVDYYSIEELVEALGNVGLPRPFFHIGGGSNILLMNDFPGTVLHSCIRFIDHTRLESGVSVRAGAGVPWDDFCLWCAERGLWGPENLSMIPGEVGAAAVQNIGAYGREVCEIISTVECFDTEQHTMVALRPEECAYGYRDSIFKNGGKGRYIVTAVSFNLREEYSPELGYGNVLEAVTRSCGQFAVHEHMLTPSQVRSVIVNIRSGKLPDPVKVGSAGSFFRNPVVPAEKYGQLARDFGETVPHYDLGGGKVKIPAAWLIDRCGWKGYRGANAGVWDSQPLVIVNATGNASPQEIKDLEDRIRASVLEKFGIELMPEVEHVS